MTGQEKLQKTLARAGIIDFAKIVKDASISAEEMQAIIDEPVCPMYEIIASEIEKRFTHYTKRGEFISRYAKDDEASLEEAIEELFMIAEYDTSKYAIRAESLFDSPGYETGYCAISWISKVSGDLETFDFQWEAI